MTFNSCNDYVLRRLYIITSCVFISQIDGQSFIFTSSCDDLDLLSCDLDPTRCDHDPARRDLDPLVVTLTPARHHDLHLSAVCLQSESPTRKRQKMSARHAVIDLTRSPSPSPPLSPAARHPWDVLAAEGAMTAGARRRAAAVPHAGARTAPVPAVQPYHRRSDGGATMAQLERGATGRVRRRWVCGGGGRG